MCATINPNSPSPMYKQLSDIIKNNILAGMLEPGERIGSISELMQKYSVSRITAVGAIKDLVKGGYVVCKQGKGSFVKQQEIEEELLCLRTSQEITLNKHVDVQVRILSTETIATPEEIAPFFMEGTPKLFHVRRLHLLRGKSIPIALYDIYIHDEVASIIPLMEEKVAFSSVYQLLEANSMTVTYARQKIGARSVTKAETKILGLAYGSPLLTVERISFTDGKPIIYSTHLYNPEHYSFSISLTRPTATNCNC